MKPFFLFLFFFRSLETTPSKERHRICVNLHFLPSAHPINTHKTNFKTYSFFLMFTQLQAHPIYTVYSEDIQRECCKGQDILTKSTRKGTVNPSIEGKRSPGLWETTWAGQKEPTVAPEPGRARTSEGWDHSSDQNCGQVTCSHPRLSHWPAGGNLFSHLMRFGSFFPLAAWGGWIRSFIFPVEFLSAMRFLWRNLV